MSPYKFKTHFTPRNPFTYNFTLISSLITLHTLKMAATATKKSTTKSATKTKKPRSYPSFYVMISEAIISLKERTGSSQYAISKFIEEKHKKSSLPANFKKLLLVHLKKLVSSGELTKVKNSYKLTAAKKVSKPAAPSKKAAPTPKADKVKAKKAKTATKKTEEKKKRKKATPVKKAPKRVKVAKKVTPKKAKK